MSYTRSFTKTIAVHYSGSVSYPASQSGGTTSYSGTAYETVTVNVNVDTDPFDASVAQCNTGVGMLTGSVVATEAAQVASIGEAAQKVGSTIVKGFQNRTERDQPADCGIAGQYRRAPHSSARAGQKLRGKADADVKRLPQASREVHKAVYRP